MKCIACGQEILDNARFCAFCGAAQETPVEVPAEMPVEVPVEVPVVAPVTAAVEEPAEAPVVVAVEEIVEAPLEEIPAEPVEAPLEEVPAEPAEAPLEEVPAEPAEVSLEEVPAEPAEVPLEEVPAEPAVVPAEVPAEEPAPEPVFIPAPAAPIPQYVQPQYVQPQYVQPQYAQPQYVQPQYAPPQPQYVPPQPQYVPPQPAAPTATPPARKLPTGRGLGKMFWLGLLTGNIYKHVILSRIPEELNIVACRRDGRRTQQYFWMLVLSSLTLGIYPLCWFHGLCNRIGDELEYRRINYRFGASAFWLWYILYFFAGNLIAAAALIVFSSARFAYNLLIPLAILLHIGTLIGPWIFTYKLMKAMNLVNADYNAKG